MIREGFGVGQEQRISLQSEARRGVLVRGDHHHVIDHGEHIEVPHVAAMVWGKERCSSSEALGAS